MPEWIYYKLNCTTCERPVLVGVVLNGTNHNMSVSVTCAQCLHVDKDYKVQHPIEAEDIEKWVVTGKGS